MMENESNTVHHRRDKLHCFKGTHSLLNLVLSIQDLHVTVLQPQVGETEPRAERVNQCVNANRSSF